MDQIHYINNFSLLPSFSGRSEKLIIKCPNALQQKIISIFKITAGVFGQYWRAHCQLLVDALKISNMKLISPIIK